MQKLTSTIENIDDRLWLKTDQLTARQWEQYLWCNLNKYLLSSELEDCVVYIKNTEKNVFEQRYIYGAKIIGRKSTLKPLNINVGEGIVGAVAASGYAEIISNTANDKRYVVDDKFRYSELSVPICFHSEVIGVIDSEHSRKEYYTSRHLQVFTDIAQNSELYLQQKYSEMISSYSYKKILELECQLEILKQSVKPEEKIVIHSSKGFQLLDQNQIIYIKAEGSYTKFFLTNRKILLASKNLKEYEARLNTQVFLRVHHSYLINQQHISEYDRVSEQFLMEEGHSVPISYRRKQDILAQFL